MELGDLEDTVRRFAEMLGWNDEITELMTSQETAVSSTVSQAAAKQTSCRLCKFVWVIYYGA